MSKFRVGDRVAFAREFLRNTGQVMGWAPFARGTVLSTASFGIAGRELVRVMWDPGTATYRSGAAKDISGVLDCNLVRIAELHRELA